MSLTATDGSIVGHKWERSGLGCAPYQYLGMEEKVIIHHDGTQQAAGTCQHCWTGIRYCFWVRSADGQKFCVGSSCINALGDQRLVAIVESETRKRERKARDAKKQAKEAAQVVTVRERMPEYLAALVKLEEQPHPNAYFAGQGKTKADYFRYFHNAEGLPNFYRQAEAIRAAS